MSILGSKGNANAQDKKAVMPRPPMPPAPRPPEAAPFDPRNMPPAVREWASAQAALWDENERLKVEIRELKNQLEVAQRMIEDKDRAITFERNRVAESDRWKEVCQRYAVEINKGLKDGLALIEHAQASAMDLARQRPVDKLEKAVAEAVETARQDIDGEQRFDG